MPLRPGYPNVVLPPPPALTPSLVLISIDLIGGPRKEWRVTGEVDACALARARRLNLRYPQWTKFIIKQAGKISTEAVNKRATMSKVAKRSNERKDKVVVIAGQTE
ncbi:unnamed protein product [Mesocestoides corti]|uniref:OmpA-like domain-containing protein n=1 Tax=Mesocestoides corti TaxID=53468 RepID=A0A0R3UE30_MESCO|nr:unnamed protein product [Mesocestoides corti]